MKDLIETTEVLQKEMSEFIKQGIEKNPKLSYDDWKDIFFMLKIAELQMEIHTLKYPLE